MYDVSVTKQTRPEITTGELIKRLLAFNGLTQQDMADTIGCSRSSVSQKCAMRPRKGPIVRGIRTVLAAPFAVLAFALVTVAMFSARAAMWISAGYRGAVKVEAEL